MRSMCAAPGFVVGRLLPRCASSNMARSSISRPVEFSRACRFFYIMTLRKGAVLAITRSLCKEVGDDGIRVNCIAPGSTMSENVRKRTNWKGSGAAAQLANRMIKREQLPDDLVGAVLFLSSAESDFRYRTDDADRWRREYALIPSLFVMPHLMRHPSARWWPWTPART